MSIQRAAVAGGVLLWTLIGLQLAVSREARAQDYESDRIEGLGFSLSAPPGEGWVRMPQEQMSGVSFAKRAGSYPNSFTTSVFHVQTEMYFETPQQFLKHVQADADKKLDNDNSRFAIIEHQMQLDDRFGPYCIKHYIKSQDRQAVGAAGKTLTFEILTYMILHPEDRTLLINVGYSARYLPDDQDARLAALRAEGEKFIEGFKIEPLQ